MYGVFMEIKDLYNYIEKENLTIISANFSDLHGLYIEGYIVLPTKFKNTQDEFMTVAEEIAHYEVGTYPSQPFNTDYNNKLIRSKNEFKAFKWMQDKLIPYDMQKYKYDTLWEISEDLEMPPEFVKQVIEYRKENFNG